ncbi:hypothetical protein CE91St54_09680 [Hungatella hathewayi]|uniref:IstB-like ATP-binding domain-containing protein n=1 Tax=Hungatella hathewayi TaxID=154046 RepID=A0AA37JDV0_9FIRM|nr:hypothetical protein CE91St55_10180 [Hungatella hathewayi]GKH05860.1 hypothetical protein CE91St54_09680 [Hungatella hathewayi]
MACAFGMEACKQRYKTKYVWLPDRLLELEMSRNDRTYKKVQAKYANTLLLIIDDCFTDVATNHPLSSVRCMIPVDGTISLAEIKALWQKQSSTGLSTMPIRLMLFPQIQLTTDL